MKGNSCDAKKALAESITHALWVKGLISLDEKRTIDAKAGNKLDGTQVQSSIDVNFDFTSDTPYYWDNFWENNNGLGGSKSDPDALSKTLQRYHQIIWSRPLPNGETMELQAGAGATYLTWKDFRFGSDSIIASFRYEKYRYMIEQVQQAVPDYRAFMEEYLHRSYTIGGTIIFPKRPGGINQSRGCNAKIHDRWDLTLECIRRYYNGETSPLYDALCKDKAFFDLFVDFKGYVDFFFLQDCVTSDYKKVIMWCSNSDLESEPLPQSVDAYLLWIYRALDFVDKRNKRIQEWIDKQ